MNRLRLRRRAVAAENLCDECRQDLPAIVELGAPVQAGQTLLRIHARSASDAEAAATRIRQAIRIESAAGTSQHRPQALVWQRIGAEEARG